MNIFREIAKLFRRRQKPHEDSVGTEQDFWKRCQREIEDGTRLDPLWMSHPERQEATRRITREMKWSPGFVKAMSSPMLLRALEGGGVACDPLSGDEVDIHENPNYAHVSQLTRQHFIDDNAAWKSQPFRFDQPKPDIAEELGDKA